MERGRGREEEEGEEEEEINTVQEKNQNTFM